jgi:hypothetical protein
MTAYKGLDDLLAAGRQPRRLTGDQVPAFFAKIRARLFGPAPVDGPPVERLSHEQAQPAAPSARPPFPIDAFPSKVAAFARLVATAMGCPLDFPGLGILVVSGAAIGAARSLKVKEGWHEKPGMYAVIVSRPGTAKTPALKAIIGPFYEEQDRLDQGHEAALKKYKQDMEAYKQWRESEDGEPPPNKPTEPPPMRHLFVADTTVEALGPILKENRKGILLFRDELTAWVRGLDQYKGKGTDRQFFSFLLVVRNGQGGQKKRTPETNHHSPPFRIRFGRYPARPLGRTRGPGRARGRVHPPRLILFPAGGGHQRVDRG